MQIAIDLYEYTATELFLVLEILIIAKSHCLKMAFGFFQG